MLICGHFPHSLSPQIPLGGSDRGREPKQRLPGQAWASSRLCTGIPVDAHAGSPKGAPIAESTSSMPAIRREGTDQRTGSHKGRFHVGSRATTWNQGKASSADHCLLLVLTKEQTGLAGPIAATEPVFCFLDAANRAKLLLFALWAALAFEFTSSPSGALHLR